MNKSTIELEKFEPGGEKLKTAQQMRFTKYNLRDAYHQGSSEVNFMHFK